MKPSNARDILKQWLDVHNLPLTPMSEQIVDGHSRQVWWNAEGKTAIESFTIANIAHDPSFIYKERGCGALHDRGGYLLIGPYRDVFWVE